MRDIELLFSVADSGIGIPKEKQAVIFEAFSRPTVPQRENSAGPDWV